MEFFSELNAWHWLIFALVLLGFEVLGTAGFLLGMAIAALLQSLMLLVVPEMSWKVQLVVYAFTSVLFSVLYWKVFRKFNTRSDEPLLNNRAGQLIGRQLILDETIENGLGRIQIGDTQWKVNADGDIAAGTKVTVVSTEGMTLFVKAEHKAG
ncbi:MAG: NfeD family protein [Amphritea sp.]